MELTIDGRSVHSREELHRVLGSGLAFPDWYGGNLDALRDCLSDLEGETELVILHFEQLQDALGWYAHQLLQALRRAETENPGLHVTIR